MSRMAPFKDALSYWFQVWKDLNQKKTIPLLQSVLYAPKFIVDPKLIQWGKDNEQVACQMYTNYMRRNSHPDLCVHKCGFIIHPKSCWLGASPDFLSLVHFHSV